MNLEVLLSTMRAELVDGVFVFATVQSGSLPPGLKPQMVFEEAEGTTYILDKTQADGAGVKYEFSCRMITLDVHSSLEAVGFIAKVATQLAADGMGVNPVSGFFHDHLFVPEGREQDALAILERLAIESRGQVT